MKIEAATVTQLTISEVPRLDPIRVTLTNYELGKGRITIECYSKAWSAYWGAMSDRTVEQFFMDCTNDYLIGNLSVGLFSTRNSGEALERDAKRVIRHRRKGIGEWKWHRLSNDEAEELMNRVHVLSDCDGESAMWAQSGLLTEIYGEEWRHLAQSEESNPEWNYLERICDVVREGLKEYIASTAQAA